MSKQSLTNILSTKVSFEPHNVSYGLGRTVPWLLLHSSTHLLSTFIECQLLHIKYCNCCPTVNMCHFLTWSLLTKKSEKVLTGCPLCSCMERKVLELTGKQDGVWVPALPGEGAELWLSCRAWHIAGFQYLEEIGWVNGWMNEWYHFTSLGLMFAHLQYGNNSWIPQWLWKFHELVFLISVPINGKPTNMAVPELHPPPSQSR